MFVEEKKEDVTFRETGTAYETKDDSLVAEYEAELERLKVQVEKDMGDHRKIRRADRSRIQLVRIWRRLCCRNRIKIFCRGHMELKNIYSQMPYTYWMNQKYPFRQRIRFFWQKRSINWHDYCNASLSSPHIPLLC